VVEFRLRLWLCVVAGPLSILGVFQIGGGKRILGVRWSFSVACFVLGEQSVVCNRHCVNWVSWVADGSSGRFNGGLDGPSVLALDLQLAAFGSVALVDGVAGWVVKCWVWAVALVCRKCPLSEWHAESFIVLKEHCFDVFRP
jgi:hypothetical protein